MPRGTMTAMADSQHRTDDARHGLGPTRARVLALLEDAGEPLTASDIAERMRVHANTVRFHLDALEAAQLVVRAAEERTAPGRPRVLYTAATGAPDVSARSYRLLSEILTSMLADRLPDPAASATEAGQAWGRYLTEPPAPFTRVAEREALATLVDELDRIGFESHPVSDEDGLRVEISHCPFLEVAEDHREVVCSVHLGLVRGILEQAGGPVRAGSLEPLVRPSLCIAHLERSGDPAVDVAGADRGSA
jgi:predicted ArsR family transcriptional regulator